MNYLAENIKFLRKEKGYTQADLATKLGVNRSLIGAYEEGRAEPKLRTIQALSLLFKVSLQDMITRKISSSGKTEIPADLAGEKLRILPVAINEAGEEQISLIPQKAAAGYTRGYSDWEFVENLNTARMPFPEISRERTYRIFQIEGDSMLPVPAGSYIISEYVENWQSIRDNQCYILLTRSDGVVYKRVVNDIEKEGKLKLISDNKAYSPYDISIQEVLEVWKAVGYVSFEIPDSNFYSEHLNQKLMEVLGEMSSDIKFLKGKVG